MEEALDASQLGAADPRPLSPWLVWWAAVAAALFMAEVVLPAAYLLPGLVRPGPATLASRALPLWLQYLGLPYGSEFLTDPLRSGATALGIAAGLASVVLLVAILTRVLRGDGWPGSARSAGAAYMLLQSGLAFAMSAVAAMALTAPVPARPLGWWFLDLAAAAATAWLARRRRAVCPAAGVLAMSGLLAIAIDTAAPLGQAFAVPGGLLEAGAFVGALVAAAAAIPWMLQARPWTAGAEPQGFAGSGVLVGALLAVLVGLAVVAVSASGVYAPPESAFGDVRGRDVVVLSPHMDDEAAFAGETIAWLADHGARVTTVFTTDSRGGRALDKDPSYINGRTRVMGTACEGLGVSKVCVIDEVKDGNRMRGPRKVATIERRVAELGVVRPGTLLISVSGTGQSDHRATFAAALAIARNAGVPLFIAWGYDARHDAIAVPQAGRPLAVDGGPSALARKAAAVDCYIDFYEDRYPVVFPRVLLSGRGAHDTLSVLEPGDAGFARGARPPASAPLAALEGRR